MLAVALSGQWLAAWWGWRQVANFPEPKRRVGLRAIMIATGVSTPILVVGFLLRFERVLRWLPPGSWHAWARGSAIAWMLLSVAWLAGFAVVRLLGRHTETHDPGQIGRAHV